MNNPWLVLPIVIPLLTGVGALLTYRVRRLQRILSVTGAAGLLVASLGLLATVATSGVQAAQMGSWPAPYGITLAADLLAALLVALAGLVGFSVAIYGLAGIDAERERFGYHALYHFLLMGVCGAFLTGDLFNLYVWFEVMLMASFVLLALGGERGQMEGALKYVTLNLVASAIFLAALGLLYGLAGTLNMADLARKFATLDPGSEALLTTLAMLFLMAFGIKAAVFPLFFWLPAAYHTPPAAVSAVFAGLLTKVGVYALMRVFTLLFVYRLEYTHNLLLVIAGLTMLTGMLGALTQRYFRRVLSFNLVGHIGFMLMGLGLFSPIGLAGGIFYLAHDIVVKTNLFLVSGLVERQQGTGALAQLGGLYRARPGLALLFLVPALSLAGIPPFSGFFAKLGLLQAGLRQEEYVLVGVALLASLLTLFSMMQLWHAAFWRPAVLQPAELDASALPAPVGGAMEPGAFTAGPHPAGLGASSPPARNEFRSLPSPVGGAMELRSHHTGPSSLRHEGERGGIGQGLGASEWRRAFRALLPLVMLAALTVLMGLLAGPVFTLAERAALQLLNPAEYIRAVLGDGP